MKAALLGLIGFAVVVAAIVVVTSRNASPNVPATAVPHYQATTLRTVVLTAGAEVSRGQGAVLAQLVDGTIPAGIDRLTVLTDENCVPDGDGVSHCLNRVRFVGPRGEGEATLQHHHRMAEEPCLAPGEIVILNV
jgi:hypothetical protein